MKQKAILTSLTTLALLAGSAAVSASTYNTTTPSLPTGGFMVNSGTNYAFNYATGLWNLGGVASATLTISLQDAPFRSNPTSIPVITPVHSFGLITTPGSSKEVSTTEVAGSSPILAEVGGSSPITAATVMAGHETAELIKKYTAISNGKSYTPPTAAILADQAARAPSEAVRLNQLGFQNFVGITPGASTVWTMDVTQLLNASNSGILKLGVNSQLYPAIPYSDPKIFPNSDYALVNDFTSGVYTFGNPLGPVTLDQRYLLNSATLSVNYTPAPVAAVPVPGAVWLFGSALVGLIGFRRKSV
ncbi:MAG: hypothetical protein WCS87_19645 [Methylococcaceae bacterium]